MTKQLLSLLAWLPLAAIAQHAWTLKECTDYAVAHNIGLKQQENLRQQRALQLSTARSARLPDLNASAGQNFSFGRGLTAENTYTNTNTSSTSFSLGTTVPLFTGFQIPNTIRLNQLNLEAATLDLEKACNDVRVQVAQAYIQILYDQEMARVAHRQVAIDSLQVVRLQALLDNGRASEAEVSQQRATLAQSRLTATQADNNYRLALLTLSQLLELDTPEGFTIAAPEAQLAQFEAAAGTAEANNSADSGTNPDAVYTEALASRPEIQAEAIRLQGTEHSLKVARSGLYPQLSFSGGLGSNYYKTSGFRADGFGKQLQNNFSQYLGLNLSIPLFNRNQTRNSIRSARLDQANQQLQLDNTKKTLYKEIQQTYYNTVAARQKVASSTVAAQSAADAFRLMQAKYENGKANSTEFNEAKNNYLRSESDLVQVRYEYLYQQALMRFYEGKDLQF